MRPDPPRFSAGARLLAKARQRVQGRGDAPAVTATPPASRRRAIMSCRAAARRPRGSQRAVVVLVSVAVAHVVRVAHAMVAEAVMEVALHAAAHAIAEAFAHAPAPHGVMMPMRTQHAGEHGKAMLLRVVEALVERRGRIGEALERGPARRHGVGALLQALDWI